ncbi:MAG: chromosome partitioning protein ParB [Deltaproteobacteria bacterium]|nr:chromosome partitioning protein ParB [Deltaproteobacteria bacterium]
MQLPLDQITVKKRVRMQLGDLQPLMDSLDTRGLMNPVTVNSRYELIAGHRRLESARRLGWDMIEVRIVDARDELGMLELELEENLHRLDFTTLELAQARARIEKLRNPGLLRRIWRALVRLYRAAVSRLTP